MTALSALLQLASPALPVGAYSYSQVLESAIDNHFVHDERSARQWIEDSLLLVAARFEAPVWLRLHRAARADDRPNFLLWNSEFLASRETAELRAETAQMGFSLLRLLQSMEIQTEFGEQEICYPAAHAWTCHCWSIEETEGLNAYLYGWAENQVIAALKTVPLGQSAGQRQLLALRGPIQSVIERALQCADDEMSSQTPMFAILSSQHEVQYSRLFRS